nr:MAG TPA: hypothetical protein [Caudoviricetes sp.]
MSININPTGIAIGIIDNIPKINVITIIPKIISAISSIIH